MDVKICLNLQKRFFFIVCNLCNTRGLIYLQDDMGNKIVSLKGLAIFSFQNNN